MIARRSPLQRRTPLPRATRPIARRKHTRKRKEATRRSPYPTDPQYLAWIRERPCRAPGQPPYHHGGDAHHLRHDENGASIGAGLKDDRRAYSICRGHHQDVELGTGPWKGLSRDQIKAWENEQVAQQRAEYLAQRQHQGVDLHVA